jgi:phosphodiesterase/alkaline phosphatase D-like protein
MIETSIPSTRPLGTHHISDRAARAAHTAARIVGDLSVAIFLAWRIRAGIPAKGELGHWEVLVQLALIGGVVVGAVVARVWEMVGATIMAVFGLAIPLVLTHDHDPTTTIPLAVLFAVSPFLHWIAWQRDRPLRQVVALGALLTALLVGSTVMTIRMFDQFYGPAHPSSDLAELPPSSIDWIWSGGVTPTSAVVRAGGLDDPRAAHLIVATDDAFEQAVATVDGTDAAVEAGIGTEGTVAAFAIDGLEPDTTYHYAVEVAGELDTTRAGSFRTFPDGPSSFTVAVGSCGRLGSNGAVFDAIRAQDPLLYLQIGDLYYADIGHNDQDAFRDAYDTTLTSPAQSALFRQTPIAYTWDDHDSGPNDADSTSRARPAAQLVYREDVPHYPIARGENPIYQAFTVGRVRFLLLDTRSERSPATEFDGPAKTMLGDAQQAWLEHELLAANDKYPLIVVVSSVPWIDEETAGSDDWAGYTTERAEIADFIADNGIDGLVMVAGDAHMVAIDDGTHSDYSDTGHAAFPVFHAGALDRAGSEKGGPYTEGMFPGAGHYGLVEVSDDGGDQIGVTLRGMTWENEELVSYSFTVDGDVDPEAAR